MQTICDSVQPAFECLFDSGNEFDEATFAFEYRAQRDVLHVRLCPFRGRIATNNQEIECAQLLIDWSHRTMASFKVYFQAQKERWMLLGSFVANETASHRILIGETYDDELVLPLRIESNARIPKIEPVQRIAKQKSTHPILLDSNGRGTTSYCRNTEQATLSFQKHIITSYDGRSLSSQPQAHAMLDISWKHDLRAYFELWNRANSASEWYFLGNIRIKYPSSLCFPIRIDANGQTQLAIRSVSKDIQITSPDETSTTSNDITATQAPVDDRPTVAPKKNDNATDVDDDGGDDYDDADAHPAPAANLPAGNPIDDGNHPLLFEMELENDDPGNPYRASQHRYHRDPHFDKAGASGVVSN